VLVQSVQPVWKPAGSRLHECQQAPVETLGNSARNETQTGKLLFKWVRQNVLEDEALEAIDSGRKHPLRKGALVKSKRNAQILRSNIVRGPTRSPAMPAPSRPIGYAGTCSFPMKVMDIRAARCLDDAGSRISVRSVNMAGPRIDRLSDVPVHIDKRSCPMLPSTSRRCSSVLYQDSRYSKRTCWVCKRVLRITNE
jgi:hypothetical protein